MCGASHGRVTLRPDEKTWDGETGRVGYRCCMHSDSSYFSSSVKACDAQDKWGNEEAPYVDWEEVGKVRIQERFQVTRLRGAVGVRPSRCGRTWEWVFLWSIFRGRLPSSVRCSHPFAAELCSGRLRSIR